jgi:hypothetical protein
MAVTCQFLRNSRLPSRTVRQTTVRHFEPSLVRFSRVEGNNVGDERLRLRALKIGQDDYGQMPAGDLDAPNRVILPCSTNCMIAAAVNTFVVDARMKDVSRVAGTFSSRLA